MISCQIDIGIYGQQHQTYNVNMRSVIHKQGT